METKIERKDKSLRRKRRVTFKIRKNTTKPVLYVFRSNKHIYAQIVDNSGKTLLGVASNKIDPLSVNLEDIDLSSLNSSSLENKAISVKNKDDKDDKDKDLKSDKEKEGKKSNKSDKLSGKIAISFVTGLVLAKKAKELNIEEVVFNRGAYKYHGRIKALAEGARKGGLKF